MLNQSNPVFVCVLFTWKHAGSGPGNRSFATEVCFSVGGESLLFLGGPRQDELILGAPPPGAPPQFELTEKQIKS